MKPAAARLRCCSAPSPPAAMTGRRPAIPTRPNTICTIAGSGEQGFNGDNGPATKAALYVPQDTAVSPDGELWLLDFNNYLRACDRRDGQHPHGHRQRASSAIARVDRA